MVELPEERAARRGGRSPDIEWRTDVTYTMCFHRYCFATKPSDALSRVFSMSFRKVFKNCSAVGSRISTIASCVGKFDRACYCHGVYMTS